MHKEENNVPFFKIDQNGMMDVVGDFNPETLADILYIMKQPDFHSKIVNYLLSKFDGTEFASKLLARIETQDKSIKVIEESFVHPLQAWKNIHEN